MADAPRFRFFWGHVENTTILTMPRSDWDAAVGQVGMPIEVDVKRTPLAGISEASSVVASVAHKFSSANARFSIYRYDEKDAPTPINQDEYDVWHDLQAHPRLMEMVNAASTSANENFMNYCKENVFFVKRAPGPDHWLASVPSSIAVLIRSK